MQANLTRTLAIAASIMAASAAAALAGDTKEPENYNTTLTFSEFPDHTVIVNDYDSYGIHFYGAGKESPPFITDDPSNPTSPVLSGTPQFEGDIKGRFIDPRTGRNVTVDKFALDAGFFNGVKTTELFWFDRKGDNLGSMKNTGTGIQRFVVTGNGIARWTIRRIHDDLSGFAIDNVSFDAPPDECSGGPQRLIEEYSTHKIDLHPICSDPTKTAHSAVYTFKQLNIDGEKYALIRAPLTAPASTGIGLDAWAQTIKKRHAITRGFLSPAISESLGFSKGDRHKFGDAADLVNRSGTTEEGDELAAAATTAGADFVQQNSEKGHCQLDCVHADWRFHPGPFVQ